MSVDQFPQYEVSDPDKGFIKYISLFFLGDVLTTLILNFTNVL